MSEKTMLYGEARLTTSTTASTAVARIASQRRAVPVHATTNQMSEPRKRAMNATDEELRISREAADNSKLLTDAPTKCRRRRLDETTAARKPILAG